MQSALQITYVCCVATACAVSWLVCPFNSLLECTINWPSCVSTHSLPYCNCKALQLTNIANYLHKQLALAALQAVKHIEAMVGNAEACAQYDRLVKAVKSNSLRDTTRRVMPALHSY